MQLNEEQQLILGLVLVILVAVSLLYCLGFASILARQAWQNVPLAGTATAFPGETLEPTSPPPLEPTGSTSTP